MENYFELLSKDLSKLWAGLDFPKKAVILMLSAVAIAAISFILVKSTEPEWGVLYSDLSESDAIAISENLKDSGYQYKFSDDRRTVLVPARSKEDLRIMIAENDVIKDSNPGFDLLAKMQFGATDFQNKLTRQKIFQDELTKTIERIRGIKKARVQIAEPDRSVFATRDEHPTASVMLILESGSSIKIDQIKAIKNLVAYGIPRLQPENVFVTDQNGLSLSDKLTENSSGLTDYRKTFETETTIKIQKVLQKIVGIGNVSVEVSAEINFDRSKKTIEKYLPSGKENNNPTGVLSSAREEVETFGKGKQEPSLPDFDLESEEDGTPASGEKSTNYQKARNSKDYKISKEIEQVVYAPGRVERMTIAVALNKILTSKQKEELKELVASASGASFERGDVITVTGMQFAAIANENNDELVQQMENRYNTEFLIAKIGPMVVVLILGVGALMVLGSLLKKPLQGEEVYSSDNYYDDYAGGASGSQELLETATAMPAIEANLDPEIEKMRGELNTTISSDPSQAARLLLSYMKD